MVSHDYLAAIYPTFGRYDQAVEEAKKTIGLAPDFAIGYAPLAMKYQFRSDGVPRLPGGDLPDLRKVRSGSGRSQENNRPRSRFCHRLCASCHEVSIPRPPGRSHEHPPASLRAQAGNPRLFGPALRHRLFKKRQGGNAIGSGSGPWKIRSGRLDFRPPGFCLGVFWPLARGPEVSHDAAELAQHAAQRDRAALDGTGLALWEGFFGNAPEASRNAMAARELSK